MVERTRASPSTGRFATELPLFEGHIYQQFVAFNLNYVAKGTVTTASEIKPNPARADAQVAYAEIIKEFGQGWIHDVEFLAVCAGTDAEH